MGFIIFLFLLFLNFAIMVVGCYFDNARKLIFFFHSHFFFKEKHETHRRFSMYLETDKP